MSSNIEKYDLGHCWALFANSEGDCPELVGVFPNKSWAEHMANDVFEPSILPATTRGEPIYVCNVQTHNDLAEKLSL